MERFLIYLFVIFNYFSSVTSVKLNSCAKWNTTGITLAGNKVYGNSSNEFANPTGIFLHKLTKTLYVADHNNARIQMFALNESLVEGITAVSNLKYPTKLYVDNQETIYVALDRSKRVEKWVKGAVQGAQVGEQCLECEGVWVDEKKGYVYMSEWIRNRISRWSIETKNTTTIAGHSDRTGSTAQVLNSPQCFYVNEITDTVYVADKGNHRIQKWMKNAEEGITVAGSNKGDRGLNATSLWFPEDVFVDDETNIVYIADTNNNRIQRWLSNASSGDTIVGESGRGDASNQLNHPTDLTFDDDGNLYVCDSYNNRVQMFKLIDNLPCSIGNLLTHGTMMVMIAFSIVIQIVVRQILEV